LPVWQRLVERQKPHPERGVHVPQVVLLPHASEGGAGGVVLLQCAGSHTQSLNAHARFTGPYPVPMKHRPSARQKPQLGCAVQVPHCVAPEHASLGTVDAERQ
jgi:hypothetical protein